MDNKFTRNALQLSTDNQFIFNDIDLSNVVVVESISEPLLPSSYASTVSIEGRMGKYFQKNNIEAKDYNLSLRFIEETYADVQKSMSKLSNALLVNEPCKLQLRGFDYYIKAVPSSNSPVEVNQTSAYTEILFTSYDGLKYYGQHEVDLTGDNNFTNNGIETYGIFELTTRKASSIKITINDNQFILLNHNFEENQSLKISLYPDDQYIKLNDSLIMSSLDFNSDIFSISPGINNIKLTNSIGKLIYEEVKV